jgi:hypothetical protein
VIGPPDSRIADPEIRLSKGRAADLVKQAQRSHNVNCWPVTSIVSCDLGATNASRQLILYQAAANGWTIMDMKQDWKLIFHFKKR